MQDDTDLRFTARRQISANPEYDLIPILSERFAIDDPTLNLAYSLQAIPKKFDKKAANDILQSSFSDYIGEFPDYREAISEHIEIIEKHTFLFPVKTRLYELLAAYAQTGEIINLNSLVDLCAILNRASYPKKTIKFAKNFLPKDVKKFIPKTLHRSHIQQAYLEIFLNHQNIPNIIFIIGTIDITTNLIKEISNKKLTRSISALRGKSALSKKERIHLELIGSLLYYIRTYAKNIFLKLFSDNFHFSA
ncbi:MAG: hypothetical protein JXR42_06425 [Gammaproteobacteria bacterium]|nr:hypothetical protein [Gammaproteobacteria bacterium]